MKVQEIKRKVGSGILYIVIPKSICDDFFIRKGDDIRFSTKKDTIIMEKK
jgi:bifunctional DNA-binding transcriptional regulator/antitoxin component of YhaV-PrlF toxin-antitoxin module